MKTNYHICLPIVSLLFVFSLNACRKEMPVEEVPEEEKLQLILDETLSAISGKGVTAAIKFSNGSTWSGASGTSYKDTYLAENMLMGTGSLTKSFVAALCLKLVEQDILSLGDSISHWLPEYQYIDDCITIEQLLCNTSGIYNISDNTELWDAVFEDPAKVWPPEEILTNYLKEAYAEPGTGWYYSNTDYILLGLILEKAGGNSISGLIRDNLLDPLGLDQTYYTLEEAAPSEVAHGWFDFSGDGEYDDITLLSNNGFYSVLRASASLFSTAKDLAKWSSLLLGGSVLEPASLEMMTASCCISAETDEVVCGMGIIRIGPGNNTGMELIGYTGRVFGYLSSMFYIPEHGISVVVIINEDNSVLLDILTTKLILESVN